VRGMLDEDRELRRLGGRGGGGVGGGHATMMTTCRAVE
jgi:hypothetical protein